MEGMDMLILYPFFAIIQWIGSLLSAGTVFGIPIGSGIF
jgi:hypothetical protein